MKSTCPPSKRPFRKEMPGAIMGSYNLYKNQHGCHNQYLLNDILKGEWGFDGVVVSDWGGVHNTQEAITNGLDMEFGLNQRIVQRSKQQRLRQLLPGRSLPETDS